MVIMESYHKRSLRTFVHSHSSSATVFFFALYMIIEIVSFAMTNGGSIAELHGGVLSMCILSRYCSTLPSLLQA